MQSWLWNHSQVAKLACENCGETDCPYIIIDLTSAKKLQLTGQVRVLASTKLYQKHAHKAAIFHTWLYLELGPIPELKLIGSDTLSTALCLATRELRS